MNITFPFKQISQLCQRESWLTVTHLGVLYLRIHRYNLAIYNMNLVTLTLSPSLIFFKNWINLFFRWCARLRRRSRTPTSSGWRAGSPPTAPSTAPSSSTAAGSDTGKTSQRIQGDPSGQIVWLGRLFHYLFHLISQFCQFLTSLIRI